MTKDRDEGKARKPGEIAFRELGDRIGKKAGTNRAASKLAHGPSRWQRGVRYVWDKNRGRG